MVDISKMPSVICNLRNGCSALLQDTYQRNAIEMVSTPGEICDDFTEFFAKKGESEFPQFLHIATMWKNEKFLLTLF